MKTKILEHLKKKRTWVYIAIAIAAIALIQTLRVVPVVT